MGGNLGESNESEIIVLYEGGQSVDIQKRKLVPKELIYLSVDQMISGNLDLAQWTIQD